MGLRRSVIIITDIIGCSEISNNIGLEEYDTFLNEFHKICVKTRDLIFPKGEYNVDRLESSIRGDEMCLIVHSGNDLDEEYFSYFESEEESLRKDIENVLTLANGIKLMWLISKYNMSRIHDGLIPRGLAIGIHLGIVVFDVHPATERDKSSEGYSINITKRIEGASRDGRYSQIYVSKPVKYLSDGKIFKFSDDITLEFKGISTPFVVHEIEDIINSRSIMKSPIASELDAMTDDEIEGLYHTALINEHQFWLRKLVGYILLRKNDKRAISLLQKKDVFLNYIEEGYAYIYLNQYEKAVDKLLNAIELNPTYWWPKIALSDAYFELGQYQESIMILSEFLKEPQENRQYRNVLSRLIRSYSELNDSKKVDEIFNRVTKQKSINENALINYVAHLIDRKRYDDAKKIINQHLKDLPDCFECEAVSIRVDFMVNVKKGKEIERMKELINKAPDNNRVYQTFGLMYYEVENYIESEKMLLSALKINPKSALTNYNLACLYSLLERPKLMYKHLRKAIELSPRFNKCALSDDDFKRYSDNKTFRDILN